MPAIDEVQKAQKGAERYRRYRKYRGCRRGGGKSDLQAVWPGRRGPVSPGGQF